MENVSLKSKHFHIWARSGDVRRWGVKGVRTYLLTFRMRDVVAEPEKEGG